VENITRKAKYGTEVKEIIDLAGDRRLPEKEHFGTLSIEEDYSLAR
jgi:hypothetical protein